MIKDMQDIARSGEGALLPDVIWFDEQLIVVNKPAGLPTLPDGYDRTRPHLAQVLAPQFGRLWIVHRLDRGTSGAIVLARSAETHRDLNLQFDSHEIQKTYHALVAGQPPWEEHDVCLPLRADGDRKHRTVVDHGRGKPAVTHLQVIERLSRFTLIEARPETGRTHQIRAHLAALQLPLLGDRLYGGNAVTVKVGDTLLLARPALHAAALSFNHPVDGTARRFEAPYPPDFAGALLRLRADAAQRGPEPGGNQ